MEDQRCRKVRRCRCKLCRSRSDRGLIELHEAINRVMQTLNERARRLFAGLLARQQGRGGIERVAEITGLSRVTIRRGRREIDRSHPTLSLRLRRTGAGRQRLEKKLRAWCRLCRIC